MVACGADRGHRTEGGEMMIIIIVVSHLNKISVFSLVS